MNTSQVPPEPTAASMAPDRTFAPEHQHAVEVLVNFKAVRLTEHRLTGCEIKQAAISQGVRIQLDFVLFELVGPNRRELIRDDQIVEVRMGERFEAVPGDDNS